MAVPKQDTHQQNSVQLMQNEEVLELFDDPKVMAAVDEIGKDPSKMRKYAQNERVQKMYRFMAQQASQKMYGMAQASSK